jgi:Cof subfamily protein (haloacid dehalogenase superfamily)
MGRFKGVLIASDLDGTLLNSRKEIDVPTREAIAWFTEEGGLFTAATGRMFQSFHMLKDIVPYNAPVVFANGAQIYDYRTETILWQCDLPESFSKAAQALLDAFPEAALEIYTHDTCHIVQPNDITMEHMRAFQIPHTFCQKTAEVPGTWLKALLTAPPENLQKAAEMAKKLDSGAAFRFSTPYFLEMFNEKTDKGRGVLRLAEMCGVKPVHVYTAGDQENDLDMLHAAAVSFAPQNAAPAVLETADVILPDCDNNTIQALIEYLEKRYN